MDDTKATERQYRATAAFHERMAAAYAKAGDKKNAEAARTAARAALAKAGAL
jgi:hypothetical protein